MQRGGRSLHGVVVKQLKNLIFILFKYRHSTVRSLLEWQGSEAVKNNCISILLYVAMPRGGPSLHGDVGTERT